MDSFRQREKSPVSTGIELRTLQPLASSHIDYAFPKPFLWEALSKIIEDTRRHNYATGHESLESFLF